MCIINIFFTKNINKNKSNVISDSFPVYNKFPPKQCVA